MPKSQDQDGLAEGGDFPCHAQAGRVDQSHQIEGQAGIFLQHGLDGFRMRLLAQQVDQLDDAGLGRGQQAGFHQRRAGKPVALEQADAHVLQQVVVLGAFHFLGNDLGLGVALGIAHQHGELFRAQHAQVQLDVVGQRQPGGVGRFQHLVAKRQLKAPVAQRLQNGQAGQHLAAGHMAQHLHLQHHLVGADQFQLAAGHAFVRALHENGFGDGRIVTAGMGHGRKDQADIVGHAQTGGCTGAAEQLVAHDFALLVHDGLPRNHGARKRRLRSGRGGRSQSGQ